jgi:zinc transport system substrate-binding protein
MRNVCRRFLASMLLFALPAGAAAEAPLSVYTVNYPLAYFAERIGGAEVKVTFPAPRDVDPAFWNPDAAIVHRYQKADLILLNGAGYARWAARAALPRRKLVDTSRAFRGQLIQIENGATHSHGPSGAHAHAGAAFVTWLDPVQAISQARAVEAAFTQARPEKAKHFEEGLNRLVADLEALDRDLDTAFKPLASKPLLASHPVYQYLARRYGLRLKSVTWEPNELPDAAEWRALQVLLKKHAAQVMLWEGTPRTETASRLKALGIRTVVFDPAANVPRSGDFLGVMRGNLTSVRTAANSR